MQTHISYVVAYHIAKSGKAYTVAEDIVKPCLVDILKGLLEYSLKLEDIPDMKDFVETLPISDTIVARRVKDMAENLKTRTVETIKNSSIGHALQLDVDLKAQLGIILF